VTDARNDVHPYELPTATDGSPLEPGDVPPLDQPDDLPDLDRAEENPLALARAELAAAVNVPERSWDVDTRPGYAARFRVDITDDDLQALRRRCRLRGQPRRPDGEFPVNELRLARLVLATYNTAILRRGVVVELEDGRPMTFRDREFLALYKSGSVAEAVQQFYGTDGAVVGAGRVLMHASGWLDDPEEAGGVTQPGPTIT
jgi:hypothetical protein